MKRLFVFLLIAVSLLIGTFWHIMSSYTINLISYSSDKKNFLKIMEKDFNLDRNFIVIISIDGDERVIYSSSDEGRPIGTERIYWNEEKKYILIVGKHFIVDPSYVDVNNDEAYLLYHYTGDILHSNASQNRCSRIPEKLLKEVYPFLYSN